MEPDTASPVRYELFLAVENQLQTVANLLHVQCKRFYQSWLMYGGDPPVNPIPYQSLHFLLVINENRKRLTSYLVGFIFTYMYDL